MSSSAYVAALTSAEWNRGAWVSIRESFAGAWQRGITYDNQSVIRQSTVWSCLTLITQDIGKLGVELIESSGGIWVPTTNPAYSPVLRRPNHYQGWIKFIESWVWSKLTAGNTYVLKAYDGRGVVAKMFVLDPQRVKVLVSPSGDVFYQIAADNLAGLAEAVTVPASLIIHDVGAAPYHHLCGVPPLVAATLPASQNLSIQQSSLKLFQNSSKPGGVLSGPGKISTENAQRIKEHWESNFSGEENIGKIAVLGDGLKYEPMTLTAVETELAKQLGWTDEKICSVFHVPPFMVGVGPQPTYDNIAKLNQQYYQQALQELIECIEEALDHGLSLPSTIGVQLNIDNLLRMDQATLMETLEKGKNYLKPNEGRRRLNLPPVEGGDAVYRQQQDFSLPALAKRDAKADPFAKTGKTPSPLASEPPVTDDEKSTATLLRFRVRAKALASRYEETRVERAG